MEVYINYVIIALSVIFAIAAPLSILALRLREGFWGNLICYCNITFAGLIAFNYFELLGALIADAWVGGIFFMDFLMFWLLFAISYFILNFMTNRLSRYKVHFQKTVEQVGNGVMLFALVMNFFALVAFSYPVSPMKPDEQERVASVARLTEAHGKRCRVLSTGSLAAFSGTKEWGNPNDYVEANNNKRWLMYFNRLDGKGFLYEGDVPPKRN